MHILQLSQLRIAILELEDLINKIIRRDSHDKIAVHISQLSQLRIAILELEDRARGCAQCWIGSHAPLMPTWHAFVARAAVAYELGAAMLILDAVMAPAMRLRGWGQERSGRWRTQVRDAPRLRRDCAEI